MAKPDGGPAFPTRHGDGLTQPWTESGMSLRDWFATKALDFALANEMGGHKFEERSAARAYAIADAMPAMPLADLVDDV